MRIVILLALVTLTVGACSNVPITREPTNNPRVPVDFLFEFEGCRVYRFSDGGESIYFVRCKEGIQTSWVDTRIVGKLVRKTPHSVMTIKD